VDLLQKVEELNRSNEELGHRHVASHDLQEPLRVVASHAASIPVYGEADADADDFIAFAVDGASAARLIEICSPFARRDQGARATRNLGGVQQALRNLRGAIEGGAVVTTIPRWSWRTRMRSFGTVSRTSLATPSGTKAPAFQGARRRRQERGRSSLQQVGWELTGTSKIFKCSAAHNRKSSLAPA
jgi:hypothetical protein